MSKTIKAEITCPKCKITQVCNIYASMNVSIDPELKKEFISNKWNIFNCNKCGNVMPIFSDMLYHDMDSKFIVWYIPIESVETYDHKFLGKYPDFPKPIVVKNREDTILMVHLCDKNGAPKSEEEKDKYFQVIKEIRETYKKVDNLRI